MIDEVVEAIKPLTWLVIVSSLLALIWFAADRTPPFEVKAFNEAVGRPGEYMTIDADVRRDAHRRCNASLSRYIFADSNNVRYSLGHEEHSAEEISMIELRQPSKMRLRVFVPQGIEPGPAQFIMVIHYRCNAVHSIFPITVTVSIPFTVMP